MPKIWRVYSGADGKSHIAEEPMALKPFKDVEGSYGEGTPMQSASGIAFRVFSPIPSFRATSTCATWCGRCGCAKC